MAIGAISVVAFVGVMLTRSVTKSENEAAVATADVPAAPAAPLAGAPAVPPAPVATPSVAPAADSVDTAAVRKALADSARLARRATRDSLAAKKKADSLATAASPFALPGSTGPSNAELDAARLQGRRAADACVAALNSRDVARIESSFGTSNRKNVVRLAKDGGLEVGIPLERQVDADGVDRATATFRALLHWKNGNNEDKTASASFRAIVQRTGTVWSTRCLIDNDGGARF